MKRSGAALRPARPRRLGRAAGSLHDGRAGRRRGATDPRMGPRARWFRRPVDGRHGRARVWRCATRSCCAALCLRTRRRSILPRRCRTGRSASQPSRRKAWPAIVETVMERYFHAGFRAARPDTVAAYRRHRAALRPAGLRRVLPRRVGRQLDRPPAHREAADADHCRRARRRRAAGDVAADGRAHRGHEARRARRRGAPERRRATCGLQRAGARVRRQVE